MWDLYGFIGFMWIYGDLYVEIHEWIDLWIYIYMGLQGLYEFKVTP